MFSFLKLKITSFENSGNKTILGDDGMLLVTLVVYYMENSIQFNSKIEYIWESLINFIIRVTICLTGLFSSLAWFSLASLDLGRLW